jgi:hypothetical protein
MLLTSIQKNESDYIICNSQNLQFSVSDVKKSESTKNFKQAQRLSKIHTKMMANPVLKFKFFFPFYWIK